MQLKQHQLYTYNKILKHQKSFIFWPRQTGKSYILSHYLEQFVNNNKDQDILFISNNKRYFTIDRDRIMKNIGYLTIDKHRTENIYFINNNYLEFCSINQDFAYLFYQFKPSLIIYDEFHVDRTDRLTLVYNYITNNSPKCIFTSTFIDMDVIKLLDFNNDWYINILPTSEMMGDQYLGQVDNYKEKFKLLSYKPDNLLDFFDVIYQRKKKLKLLNKISNES